MEISETVRKSSIFKNLGDDEVAEVLNITREIRFPKDDIIMREGDQGDTLYMVLDGEVEVSKSLTMKFGDDDYRKTEKVLTHFRAKDHVILGEMALIGQDSRSASIIAKTDCVLLEIKRDDFMRMVESKAELGVKVLLNLAELLVTRLRQSSKDVTRLTTALSIALSK
ncbi:MAG: cyclic nucleotide-binding domain-containing protein [Desulfobacterales bacterium]|nr:cyclic nucleotide-binding domain-containing protein [Desulfobacterales bacterium]